MVGTETQAGRAASIDEKTCFYSPDTVAYWLDNWDVLQEFALLTPPSSSRFRQVTICGSGASPRDRLHYLHTLCDIQIARVQLEPGSLESWAVEAAMRGITFRQAEHDHRRQNGSIAEAFPRACRQMAEILGWRQTIDHLPSCIRGQTVILSSPLVEKSQSGGASK